MSNYFVFSFFSAVYPVYTNSLCRFAINGSNINRPSDYFEMSQFKVFSDLRIFDNNALNLHLRNIVLELF